MIITPAKQILQFELKSSTSFARPAGPRLRLGSSWRLRRRAAGRGVTNGAVRIARSRLQTQRQMGGAQAFRALPHHSLSACIVREKYTVTEHCARALVVFGSEGHGLQTMVAGEGGFEREIKLAGLMEKQAVQILIIINSGGISAGLPCTWYDVPARRRQANGRVFVGQGGI
jgi:hypothetical protein